MQTHIPLHQIGDILLFGDGALRHPALPVLAEALFRIKIQVLAAAALLAYAALDIRLGRREIGLHHVHRHRAELIREHRRIRHGDEVLALFRLRRGLTDDGKDGVHRAVELVVKIDGVVDDVKIRVSAPRAQGQIVHAPRGLNVLIARHVAEVIGKLRALCTAHEMQHRIIAAHDLLLGLAEVREREGELLVAHIRLVVEHGAVVHYEHILLRHELRRAEGELFLVKLVGYDEVLKILHGHAVAERLYPEAGDKLRRGLRNDDDAPAVLRLELLEYAADERRFAGGRTAREHDAGDVFGHDEYSVHMFFCLDYNIGSRFFQGAVAEAPPLYGRAGRIKVAGDMKKCTIAAAGTTQKSGNWGRGGG